MTTTDMTASAAPVSLDLDFRGPFTFAAGPRSLFDCADRSVSSVYVWTIRSERDSRYYVHYVGEAEHFARRQREHLVHVLGLNYGILDPAAARRGEVRWVGRGLWRDRTPAGPADALARYPLLTAAVTEYLEALDVFVAPVEGDRAFRRRVERALADRLRLDRPESGVLYPADNRVSGAPGRDELHLHISGAAPIAGIEGVLVIPSTPVRPAVR